MTAEVYSVLPSSSFVGTVAQYVLANYATSAGMLSELLLLVPSRRAGIAMREALLRESAGDAHILPRIVALDDVHLHADILLPELIRADDDNAWDEYDAIAPAVDGLSRSFSLALMIYEYRNNTEFFAHSINIEQALRLAQELGSLLDEMYEQGVSAERLRGVVADEFAEHWQMSLKFLEFIISAWPEFLSAQSCQDSTARRIALVEFLVRYWRAYGVPRPVLVVGSTGSVPSTGRLMACVAQQEAGRGAVILPGLDVDMPARCWEKLDLTHPQYVMKQWLEKACSSTLEDVKMLAHVPVADEQSEEAPLGEEALAARYALLRDITLPAEMTHVWQGAVDGAQGYDPKLAIEGMSYIPCRDAEEEAAVVSLVLRNSLHHSGKTAALVTNDRVLARRVMAMMQRYGVQVDDSEGVVLSKTAEAGFALLVGELCMSRASAVSILSVLKHPFCCMEFPREVVRRAARELDRIVLRVVREDDGFDCIIATAKEALNKAKISADTLTVLEALSGYCTPLLAALKTHDNTLFVELLRLHMTVVEQLNGGGQSSSLNVWSGHSGKQFADVVSSLLQSGGDLKAIQPSYYLTILESVLAQSRYRPSYGTHARLRILTPIEARMQHVDVMVLSGLNEGIWPAASGDDPWLSIPMREQLGLNTHAREIGQAAHDFVSLCMARKVVLTRAEKSGSEQSIPSRWVLRLLTRLENESSVMRRLESDAKLWREWAQQWQGTDERIAAEEPRPIPPVSVRPNSIAVTSLERLIRDPYNFYAAKILRLRKLDDLDKELGVSDFGNIVHDALDGYYQHVGNDVPNDALEQLLKAGEKQFSTVANNVQVQAFWWPRFEAIARKIIEQDVLQISEGRVRLESEKQFSFERNYGGRNISVTAKIDRVEYYQDGGACVVDYKTGTVPEARDVVAGVACQLSVATLLVAKNSAFPMLPNYWKLGGGNAPVTISTALGKSRKEEDGWAEKLVDVTQVSVDNILTFYAQESSPYLCMPREIYKMKYNDFEHLSRSAEWL